MIKHDLIISQLSICLQIGEVVVQKGCQEKLICQKNGIVKYESMACKADEICQVENGVTGCYPKQCKLETPGSFTLFNGTTWSIPSMGAYDLVNVCDDIVIGIWFRVVAVLQERNGVLTTAAVHIFFENVLVTITSKNDIWVSNKSFQSILFTIPPNYCISQPLNNRNISS